MTRHPWIEEAGVKGCELTYWFATYAPAFYQPTGTDVFLTTPDELRKVQTAESQKWARVIKASGIEPA
jgi:hypothetical protein